jgi:hypothetical protein
MSDNTNTAPSGADAAAPAPKSDAEAALQTQATPEAKPEPTAEQQAAEKAEQQRQEEEGKKKNRTREYIGKLQARVAELEGRLHSQVQPSTPRQGAPSPQQNTGDRRPTLEDYGYDFNAWHQADTQWIDKQAERRAAELLDQRTQQQREQETWSGWAQRSAAFAETHDDFEEVVGSMPGFNPALQEAIARHPNGPAIAYHLGTNPADLLAYANTHPQFADLALQQIAARLSAAPPQPVQPPPVAPPAAPAPTKPLTQAPPPPPMVGGRSPTETPAEKLTDDQWYAKDRERRRKR